MIRCDIAERNCWMKSNSKPGDTKKTKNSYHTHIVRIVFAKTIPFLAVQDPVVFAPFSQARFLYPVYSIISLLFKIMLYILHFEVNSTVAKVVCNSGKNSEGQLLRLPDVMD